MSINKVIVFNFGVFRGRHSFDFQNGLNCISGPNNSGKTALIDAIRFILDRDYEDKDGVTGSSPSTVPMYVQIVLQQNEHSLILTRTGHNPDRIDINDRDVLLEEFHKDLGSNVYTILTGDNLFGLSELDVWKLFVGECCSVEACDKYPTERTFREAKMKFLDLQNYLERHTDLFEEIQSKNLLLKKYHAIKSNRFAKIHSIVTENTAKMSARLVAGGTEISELINQYKVILERYIAEQTEESLISAVHSLDFKVFDPVPIPPVCETLKVNYNHIKHLLETIVFEHKKQVEVVAGQTSLDVVQNRREIELEFLKKSLCLLKTPPITLDAIKYKQNHLKALCGEYQERIHKSHEDLLLMVQRSFDFRTQFLGIASDIEALSESIDDFHRETDDLRIKIEADNTATINQRKDRANLEELGQILDYNKGILNGLVSVMDLIHNDALLATDTPNQFLGPIFQIIQFKPNVDIVSLLYFRDAIKDWYPVILVRTFDFAQRLMAQFNRQKCKGEIKLVSIDNYVQRTADHGLCEGRIWMSDVIVDGNPLKNFFTNIYYDPDSNDHCIVDPDSGGLTVSSNHAAVHGQSREMLLATYLGVATSLARGHNDQNLDIEIGLYYDKLNNVASCVDDIKYKMANLNEFIDLHKNIDGAIESIVQQQAYGRSLVVRLEAVQQIYNLIEIDEFNSNPIYYEKKLDLVLKQRRATHMIGFYDNSIISGLLMEVKYAITGLIDADPIIIVPHTSLTSGPLLFDPDTLLTPSPLEYSVVTAYELALQQAVRDFRKLNRLQRLHNQILAKVTDPQHRPTRMYQRKSLNELDTIQRAMNRDRHLNFRSRPVPGKTVGTVRRIAKETERLEQLFDEYEQLRRYYEAILSLDSSTHRYTRILRIVNDIRTFYRKFNEGAEIHVFAKLRETSKAAVINSIRFDDIMAWELVFSDRQQNVRLSSLSKQDRVIFFLAVIYTRMMENGGRLLFLDGINGIDPQIMTQIFKIFSDEGFQIIFTNLTPWHVPEDNRISLANISL